MIWVLTRFHILQKLNSLSRHFGNPNLWDMPRFLKLITKSILFYTSVLKTQTSTTKLPRGKYMIRMFGWDQPKTILILKSVHSSNINFLMIWELNHITFIMCKSYGNLIQIIQEVSVQIAKFIIFQEILKQVLPLQSLILWRKWSKRRCLKNFLSKY